MDSSLLLNVGRKTSSPYIKMSKLNPFKITDSLASLIARMLEYKNVGNHDGLLSQHLVYIPD